tara:strand:- start:4330 stop:4779 length:450 start_codon:yes stop_codon:yes gene_type:complete
MRALIISIVLIFLILVFSKKDVLAPIEINKKKIRKRRKITNTHNTHNTQNDLKILKYFGQDYCPYSNKQSYMYNVLNTKFRKMYPNVRIEFNWAKTQYEMNESAKANVEYVPTITNANYQHINVYISDKLDNKTEMRKLAQIYESLSPT